MKYNGIVIADLHVGVMDLNKFHEEFNGILISEIQKMKKLDFLIIAGDYFDHKFYLNDRESTMAYYMLNELIDACKKAICDFFVKDNQCFLNEINPIPGSLANYLFVDFRSALEELSRNLLKPREIKVGYEFLHKIQFAKGK